MPIRFKTASFVASPSFYLFVLACLVLKMLCNKFGISDATLAATTSFSWERKGTSIIGVSAGVVMLCFGAYAFFTASVGCDSTSFGGDAYTYIYKGIVATAKTLYLICRCLGMALMCGGAAMSCHFASRFGK